MKYMLLIYNNPAYLESLPKQDLDDACAYHPGAEADS